MTTKLIHKRDESEKINDNFNSISFAQNTFFLTNEGKRLHLMNLRKLQTLNPNIDMLDITDSSFSAYGKILEPSPFKDYFNYLDKQTTIPQSLNQYIAFDPVLSSQCKDHLNLQTVFGKTELQFGYVNGNNSHLNALEYHPSNEINLALTPLVLLLGLTKDIHNQQYDVKRLKAFYIPAYTAIILNPTTLHFSPCKVSDSGFKCGVILPYGTNMVFVTNEEKELSKDPLLFKTNKCLIAHPDNTNLVNLGAFPGLIGDNLMIQYK
jgi:hypothetical protein